jgi:hypothetical protein
VLEDACGSAWMGSTRFREVYSRSLRSRGQLRQ